MYGNIVIGWDGGDQARDALALAGLLRAKDAAAVAACVSSESEEEPTAGWEGSLAATGSSDWVEPRAIAGRSAADGLRDFAEKVAADLIVVGSSRSEDVGRVVTGSVADRLLYASPCALAIAPNGFRDTAAEPRLVGVAYDGSEGSVKGLEVGARITRSLGASLRLVGVVSPLELAGTELLQHPSRSPAEAFEERRAELLRMLRAAAESVPSELSPQVVVAEGRPGDIILREAWNGMHLLVMGARTSGPPRRLAAGGTAIEVMRRAPCPVLVVPGRAAAPNTDKGAPVTADA